MTEEEFIAWVGADDTHHAEWVDGEVIVMAPISDVHDLLQWWLRTCLQLYVARKKLGTVRGPEFTARFARMRRRREPDVLFVSKRRARILTTDHVEGPPDLIIEIVSPDSVVRDWQEKFAEYAAAGVKQYWIVDPKQQVLAAFQLGRGRKYRAIKEAGGKVASAVVPGWHLRPAWLWAKPLPDVLDALSELGVR